MCACDREKRIEAQKARVLVRWVRRGQTPRIHAPKSGRKLNKIKQALRDRKFEQTVCARAQPGERDTDLVTHMHTRISQTHRDANVRMFRID